jgi:hypothetical protein
LKLRQIMFARERAYFQGWERNLGQKKRIHGTPAQAENETRVPAPASSPSIVHIAVSFQ